MIVYQISLTLNNKIYIGKSKNDRLKAARGAQAFKLLNMFPSKIQNEITEHGPARLYFQPITKVNNDKEANKIIKERKERAAKIGRIVL